LLSSRPAAAARQAANSERPFLQILCLKVADSSW